MPQTKEQLKYKVKDMPSPLGPKGDRTRRSRDARPDGLREEPWQGQQAAERRPHRRLPAHDHPDRRAHRDPGGTRRRSELVSCNISSTQDHAAAAIAAAGIPVYAWKGMNNEEFDWCIEQTSSRSKDGKPLNMILDDGGDLTNMVLDKFPELVAGIRASAKKPPPACTACTSVRRPNGTLPMPAINVNDSVTKSQVRQQVRLQGKRRGRHPPRHRHHDGRQSGRRGRLRRRGQRHRSFAARRRRRVIVTEIDPICALQAAMDGYEVKRMAQCHSPRADIVITATGNCDIVTGRALPPDEGQNHRVQHRPLRQRDRHGLAEQTTAIPKWRSSRRWTSTHRRQGHHRAGRRPPGEPGLRHGPPQLRDVQLSFTNQVLAQLELWQNHGTTRTRCTCCPSTSTRWWPACTSPKSAWNWRSPG
jgi:hypothetical protein